MILRDLMQNNCIHSFANILIDFDVLKILSQQHERAKVLAELKEVGFHNYINSHHVKWGLDYESRINSWLSTVKDAPFFMELTLAQKILRHLPFWARYVLQRFFRRIKKIIFYTPR